MGNGRKKGFDRAVTARSNGTLAFVFNKTSMGGWGLAEGHKQRVARRLPEMPESPEFAPRVRAGVACAGVEKGRLKKARDFNRVPPDMWYCQNAPTFATLLEGESTHRPSNL